MKAITIFFGIIVLLNQFSEGFIPGLIITLVVGYLIYLVIKHAKSY